MIIKREEWFHVLRQIYRSCRNYPGWPLLFSFHDEEDQNYFRLLEERKSKMVMEVCYLESGELFVPREIDAPVEDTTQNQLDH